MKKAKGQQQNDFRYDPWELRLEKPEQSYRKDDREWAQWQAFLCLIA